jgi:rubrerythrin
LSYEGPSYISKLEEQVKAHSERHVKVLSELGDAFLQLESIQAYIAEHKNLVQELARIIQSTNHQILVEKNKVKEAAERKEEKKIAKTRITALAAMDEKVNDLFKKA